jgi:PTS system nitrogen regulatory IIA component
LKHPSFVVKSDWTIVCDARQWLLLALPALPSGTHPPMPEEDFNIDSLANYLHLDRAQVARLAERGQLPGRRIGGDWRFPQAEIHHWLERKIGLADEDRELVHMEGALERADRSSDAEAVSVAGLLTLDMIAIPLAAKTRNSVIDSMVELAAVGGHLWDPPKMAAAVRSREELFPTAMENGVAFLHPRRPLSGILGQAVLALGRTDRGIPFGGARGTLTDVFFLICSIEDRAHLRVLARLSRLVGHPDFLGELRAAPDAQAAHELIARVEGELTA